jgi:alpha-D-xyloside xylohydrolase
MQESVMLEMDNKLEANPLNIEKTEDAWWVKDAKGTVRAKLDRKPIEVDYWSDLLSEPEKSI